jgi:putative membrane-bound dehydrogenase-like protein
MRVSLLCLLLAVTAKVHADSGSVKLPTATDARLKIELFAAEPEIVTPCGIAVDAHGNVLVVESHTHFRPENYVGPPADRVRMFADTDGDGRADRVTTFHEGTRSTMNVAVHPDGSVYLATRMEILRLRDTNGDGQADEKTHIAHLETKGDYPHNGLSGFAFDFRGDVFFGLGENLGSAFKLIGTDGSIVSDLEGGQIYTCRADGSAIRRVAFGFWNPFHVAFDAFGRLFAVDNDPDSMPPCRLMHIVAGGNYGYRYRNGRKGVHPFTAWNGELPGTLPMLAGTGEAPSGVLAYESDHLPEDYIGNLLVTSWGDHRLERYRLEPRGASFRAVTETFVKGDDNFRPVGIAVAPDGSLFVSDWVLQDYNVHGKGRIWHVTSANPRMIKRASAPELAVQSTDRPTRERAARELLKAEDGRMVLTRLATESDSSRVRALAITALASTGVTEPAVGAATNDPAIDVRSTAARVLGDNRVLTPLVKTDKSTEVRAEILRHTADPALLDSLWAAVSDSDAFAAQAAREGLARLHAVTPDMDFAARTPTERLACLLILREANVPGGTKALPKFLRDRDTAVRFAAVQWVGEERLKEFRQPLVEALSVGPATSRLFGGYLSALERIDGVVRTSDNEWGGEQYIVRALEDPKTSAEARRWCVRMLRPDHPLLTAERLREYLQSDDAGLQLEAVCSLRDSKQKDRDALLAEIADSDSYSQRVRAEAIVGISPASQEAQSLLLKLACGSNVILRNEALRSLRGATLDDKARESLKRVAAEDSDAADLVARVVNPETKPQMPAPSEIDAWLALLHGADGPSGKIAGDAEAGERIFFHRQAAACARCHQIGGRGAKVGPELTTTAGVLDERRLIESIVQPSKEIAPQFVSWLVLTTSGQSHTGVLVKELATGEQTYSDQNGQLTEFKAADIESRRPQATSLMPEGLPAQMTVQEFRDLLAFLRSPAKPKPAAVPATTSSPGLKAPQANAIK